MKGDEAIIEVLNGVLTAELTAINQYFVDSRMCANWGYQRLADHIRATAMDEMRDAEELIDRILFLEGIPNLQRLGPVRVGETVPEKLALALEVELEAIGRLNEGVAQATSKGDNGSRLLLEEMLKGEEEHADWLETQLEMINQLGEKHYLAEQVGG